VSSCIYGIKSVLVSIPTLFPVRWSGTEIKGEPAKCESVYDYDYRLCNHGMLYIA